MNTVLLWKEYRLLRETLMGAIALLAISYVLAAALIYSGGAGEFHWGNVLAGGASLARFSFVLICALIGGQVYGREREERTDVFLAQLPLRRWPVLRLKLVAAVAVLLLMWAVSMLLLVIGVLGMGHGFDTGLLVLQGLLGFLAAGLLVFGGAFLASFQLSSAIGAAFAGLLWLAPVLVGQAVLNWALNREGLPFFHWGSLIVMGALGVGCVGAAACAHLRGAGAWWPWNRAEPSMLASSFATYPSSRRPSLLGAVIWKDFRTMKVSLLFGVVLLALPYLIVGAGSAFLEDLSVLVRGASFISLLLGVVVFAFWAGQVSSLEHLSHTSEFSGYLPIPPKIAVLSTLLLSVVPALLFTGINLACLVFAHNSSADTVFDAHFSWGDWIENGFIVMGFALGTATPLASSQAWLLGTRYQRPTLAIIAGIVSTPVLVLVWASTSTLASESVSGLRPLYFVSLFGGATLALSFLAVLVGTAGALRAGHFPGERPQRI